MKQIDIFNSMNIDDFIDWLDNFANFEESQWLKWWDETYCKKCEGIWDVSPNGQGEAEYGYCELHGNCRYFPEMSDAPDNKQIIRLWLESEA